MKSDRAMRGAALAVAAMLAVSVCASALEYTYDGVEETEYYPSTSYESTYGAQYNYGGQNAVDFEIPELPYGVYSNTSVGCMEKVRIPGQSVSYGSLGFANIGEDFTQITQGPVTAPPVYQAPAYTSVDGMEREDGSLGVVTIPSLKISMKVWEGETNASMSKGLGHYSSSSAWDGNVAVCGHNRGAKYVIGAIKDMQIGEKITYTTVYGTRTYEVTYVGEISSTDWSYIQATADNRITLTTCLADQPAKRVCVQAVEVNS